MAKDWFRQTSWNETCEADFYARLKRCRSGSTKAQYLRVQAHHLAETGSAELVQVALTLLDKMIVEFPASPELACGYHQKAMCLALLGRTGDAVECYRLALDTERKNPRRETRAWLDFGRLVCETKLTALFDESIALLDERKATDFMFATDVYQACGIRAIVAAFQGNRLKAKEHAVKALVAAAETKTDFRYHPTIGLVRASEKETTFFKFVKEIAES